jgi:hypothetical protein
LETEELVVSFAGRETFDQFKFHLKKLIDLFENNSDLRHYLSKLKKFILSSKLEEDVKSEEFKRKSRDLVFRGRELTQQFNYENYTDKFLKSSDKLIHNIKNDEFVKMLRHQAGIISSDLLVNDSGKVKLNVAMLNNLKSVILPFLTETLKSIPVPRMRSCNDLREFSLENIVICGFDIIPENIHFHIESDSDLTLKKDKEPKGSKTRLVISLDNLRTELKDMKFYFKKKTFPEISDSGLVSLRVGGEGAVLNINLTITQFSGETKPQFIEGSANLNIRNMEIEFNKSTLKHDLLIPMMTSLFKQQIQQVIERIVQNNLTKVIQKLGQRLTQTLGDNASFFNGLEKASKVLKKNQGKTIVCKKKKTIPMDKTDSHRRNPITN